MGEAPLFESEPSGSALLWRYMSFAKLCAVLNAKQLHCTRADQFEDKLEGRWPLADIRYWSNQRNGVTLQGLEKMRRHAAVCCWVRQENESAAMWSLYGVSSEGVAITTRYSKLREAVANRGHAVPLEEWHVGNVQYLDFGRAEGVMAYAGPDGYRHRIFKAFTLKHSSYQHESEVRAVGVQFGNEVVSRGIDIAIEPNSFIESIVVNPRAQLWFSEVVRVEAAQYGLLERVENSEIRSLEESFERDNHGQ
jgi:hypothetical protein